MDFLGWSQLQSFCPVLPSVTPLRCHGSLSGLEDTITTWLFLSLLSRRVKRNCTPPVASCGGGKKSWTTSSFYMTHTRTCAMPTGMPWWKSSTSTRTSSSCTRRSATAGGSAPFPPADPQVLLLRAQWHWTPEARFREGATVFRNSLIPWLQFFLYKFTHSTFWSICTFPKSNVSTRRALQYNSENKQWPLPFKETPLSSQDWASLVVLNQCRISLIRDASDGAMDM